MNYCDVNLQVGPLNRHTLAVVGILEHRRVLQQFNWNNGNTAMYDNIPRRKAAKTSPALRCCARGLDLRSHAAKEGQFRFGAKSPGSNANNTSNTTSALTCHFCSADEMNWSMMTCAPLQKSPNCASQRTSAMGDSIANPYLRHVSARHARRGRLW
jgi:hypothetical protein